MFATFVPATDTALAPKMYLGTLLQEVLTAFRAPDTIQVATGAVSMWLHRDGRLSDVRAADTLVPVALVNALRVAIDSTMRRGGIGPVMPAFAADSIRLHLALHWAAKRTPWSLPVMRLQPPPAYYAFQVDKPATHDGRAFPEYPSYLRETGVEGDVLAEFHVDPNGRADMKSVRLVRFTHPDFTSPVRDAIRRMRFSPAEIDGCRVRQIVEMPFAFRINR